MLESAVFTRTGHDDLLAEGVRIEPITGNASIDVMLQITRQQPLVLRGAIVLSEPVKDAVRKTGFFLGVLGAITGFVWLASRQ